MSEFASPGAIVRVRLLSLAIACTFGAVPALAQDVTVKPAAGYGLVIENGYLTIAGLPAATTQTSALCFNSVSGMLGP